MVEAVVLTCGSARWPGAGPATVLPARPGREELDPLLAGLSGRRLVVSGTDADLAAVLLRLLRTEMLTAVAVGYVPADVSSAVAQLWGLPIASAAAASLALYGEPAPVPLLRDDAGGVLAGRGVVAPVDGVVYCDDEVVLRGCAARSTRRGCARAARASGTPPSTAGCVRRRPIRCGHRRARVFPRGGAARSSSPTRSGRRAR